MIERKLKGLVKEHTGKGPTGMENSVGIDYGSWGVGWMMEIENGTWKMEHL